MPPDTPPEPPLDVPALVQRCAPNVGLDTMKAIIHVESGGRPFVIGYKVASRNGVFRLARTPTHRAEAVAWARWMLDKGYRFDAGPAQINSVNFRAYGLTPENVFDACTNIRAGAAILTDAYRVASRKFGPGRQALLAAISAYNSGNHTTGFRNGYVQKVTAAAGRMDAGPAPQAAAASAASAPMTLIPVSGGAPVSSSGVRAPSSAPAKMAPSPKAAARAVGPAHTPSDPASAFYANPANPLTAASEVDAFRGLNPSASSGFETSVATAQ